MNTTCPYCAEEIAVAAKKCKHCGEFLDAEMRLQDRYRRQQAEPKENPAIPAVLSLVIPGAGQIYKGQTFNGLAWLMVVIVGYLCFLVPGFILHICCVVGASIPKGQV